MTFGEVEDIPRRKRRRKLKRILEKCTGRNPKQNATRSCKKCFTTKSKPPQRMHAGSLPAAVLPVREYYFLGGFINDTIRKFEKTDQGIRKIM